MTQFPTSGRVATHVPTAGAEAMRMSVMVGQIIGGAILKATAPGRPSTNPGSGDPVGEIDRSPSTLGLLQLKRHRTASWRLSTP